MEVKTKIKLSSFQIILLGFAAVIFIGAFLLSLPISSKSNEWTSFIDSLFTSTSAVCVTGLVVFDTATHWTIFGQIIKDKLNNFFIMRIKWIFFINYFYNLH